MTAAKYVPSLFRRLTVASAIATPGAATYLVLVIGETGIFTLAFQKSLSCSFQLCWISVENSNKYCWVVVTNASRCNFHVDFATQVVVLKRISAKTPAWNPSPEYQAP